MFGHIFQLEHGVLCLEKDGAREALFPSAVLLNL